MKIRGIIKDHYKQLYADNFDNLDDTDQFYERYLPILPRNNLNRPITVKFLKLIINNLPYRKALGPDEFTTEFYQTFKEEIIPILYNLRKQKIQNTSSFIFFF